MVILHKAQRIDGEGEIKGFITKMWGEYHIISEKNENAAYPVLKETITPCLPVECNHINDTVITHTIYDFLADPNNTKI